MTHSVMLNKYLIVFNQIGGLYLHSAYLTAWTRKQSAMLIIKIEFQLILSF